MDLLLNPIRRYPWGSRSAIPELLGREPDGEPQAELWMGAHPDSPSALQSGEALDRLVADHPDHALGPRVRGSFGARLPFLLKVLAAKEPLSLQVHPSEQQARAGFAAEEAAGVPHDAPHRTFRDPHHKPEMVYALTPFDVLCGFRRPHDVLAVLSGLDLPDLDALRAGLAGPDESEALRSTFTELLALRGRADDIVGRLAAACRDRLRSGSPFASEDSTVVELSRRYPDDPGVVVSLLLNRVTLQPGEALFLPAGNVHAYLHGTAVEVMASSDNVLRGGLTSKHVDVDGLCRVVDFRALALPYVTPEVRGPVRSWRPDAAEFELHRVDFSGEVVTLPGVGPRITLQLQGEARLLAASGSAALLRRGESCFVPDDDGAVQVTGSGSAVVAAVPAP